MPPPATVERVAAPHSLVARVQATEAAALAGLNRAMRVEPGPETRPDGSMVTPARAPVAPKVIDAVAPALCLGRAAAARRVQDADQLTRCLHTTYELLTGGFIDAGITQVVRGPPGRAALHVGAEEGAGPRTRSGAGRAGRLVSTTLMQPPVLRCRRVGAVGGSDRPSSRAPIRGGLATTRRTADTVVVPAAPT